MEYVHDHWLYEISCTYAFVHFITKDNGTDTIIHTYTLLSVVYLWWVDKSSMVCQTKLIQI